MIVETFRNGCVSLGLTDDHQVLISLLAPPKNYKGFLQWNEPWEDAEKARLRFDEIKSNAKRWEKTCES